MSARREDILNTFWDDEDVDALSNNAVLLYLWSFTNQRCGMAGVYACSRRGLCEGRLKPAPLEKALAELQAAGLLYYLEGWIWVCARVKRLSTINPNIARSIHRDVENAPEGHEFKSSFWGRYHDDARLKNAMEKAGLTMPGVSA